jgi:hypothetical protein
VQQAFWSSDDLPTWIDDHSLVRISAKNVQFEPVEKLERGGPPLTRKIECCWWLTRELSSHWSTLRRLVWSNNAVKDRG